MSAQVNFKNDFPFNLAIKVFDNNGDLMERFLPIKFEEILSDPNSLTERERKVISLRYIYDMTYDQIGAEIGVGRERVRQILAKIHRKLRNPARTKLYIAADQAKIDDMQRKLYLYKTAYGDMDASKETLIKGRRIINDLHLSVRSYNCLTRSGLTTIGDFDGLRIEQLFHVRNLGCRSAGEIVDELVKYGFNLYNYKTGDLIMYEPPEVNEGIENDFKFYELRYEKEITK